jgi:hypothetical protein
MMARRDWKHAVATVPLGILPGGSGNGLAASLLHSAKLPFTPVNNAFLVARGGCLFSCVALLGEGAVARDDACLPP